MVTAPDDMEHLFPLLDDYLNPIRDGGSRSRIEFWVTVQSSPGFWYDSRV